MNLVREKQRLIKLENKNNCDLSDDIETLDKEIMKNIKKEVLNPNNSKLWYESQVLRANKHRLKKGQTRLKWKK